ncbi:putative mitochondrial protein AtMg01250 [Bidens hawaiensis]|uniref:putative mitochondrial protein AtMg01250 n=1 Tax=Bidens hawaiensis TaxID=980011 RepID=UPI00404994EB
MEILDPINSLNGSVLVNGSPTLESNFKRGVKQRDPLAPFPFIIAMEGLNTVLKSDVQQNLFRGIRLPKNGPVISHVVYADDAMFIREWKVGDMVNLARLLRCFHLSTGLKVNFNKSKVFGVGVTLRSEMELKGLNHFLWVI